MSIYTRSGDSGHTSLADGQRVSKSSGHVEASGTVDEANSAVGLARADVEDARLEAVLLFLQQRLSNCASALAAPHVPGGSTAGRILQTDIQTLERAIDVFTDATGPIDTFLLPGGSEAVARLHLARTVIRRAERRTAALALEAEVDPLVQAFLNRASDLLFAAARYASRLDGVVEQAWDPAAEPPQL